LRERRSLAFETVFSAPDKPEFVRRALAEGYFVRIFFVGTHTPEINAARVARRVLQGGHEVPIRKIVDRWARSIANAASVASEVDRLYVYDNSVDDRDAQLASSDPPIHRRSSARSTSYAAEQSSDPARPSALPSRLASDEPLS
jgi:predicted ABC-type ATPase